MPPRSLRRGDKCPNPGAVHKGCSRPKVLRFDSPFGVTSPFGDGTYSGNILQGGRVLQPQNYALPGGDLLRDCIVITGAATVDPDAETVAAAFMCRNFVLSGAGATLSASTNCKGLLGFVSGRTVLRDGASLHMNKLGRAGDFGDLSPVTLLPARLSRNVRDDALTDYVVAGAGAAGAARVTVAYGGAASSNAGSAASAMQTGGGGTGGTHSSTCGAGGRGGPCCGGAGSGGACFTQGLDAGNYGGPATNAVWARYAFGCGGGAGDPVGSGVNGGSPGEGAGGGLIFLVSSKLDVGAGCFISADGAAGGNPNSVYDGGGGAGGGCVVIVTKASGYTNAGTVRAAGGGHSGWGSDGGAGSVNIFELAV